MKYNFKSFDKEFPDDAACLEYIFKSRYPDQKCECGKSHSFHRRTKRRFGGTHHSVSRKYLQNYINEFSFRYNHRKDASLFTSMVSRVPSTLSQAA